jgi:arylsulfatase A-like enzyme
LKYQLHNNRGMMGYKTPNIDRVAKRRRVHSPITTASKVAPPAAPPSSVAQCPVRIGMTKVGIPSAPEGWQKTDVTMATIMKSLKVIHDWPVRQEPSRRSRRAFADHARF